MNAGLIVGLIVVVIIIAAVVGFVVLRKPARRSEHLKEQFGPEYERAISQHGGDRKEAERELRERKERHSRLTLHTLSPEARQRYAEGWALIQERFVDSPSNAVREADQLVTGLMADRGYPTEGFEQQVADLSVEHAKTIDDYRAARDIAARDSRGEAGTEDLRNAMVHYRSLFADLLEHDLGNGTNGQRTATGDPRGAQTPAQSTGPAPGPGADQTPGQTPGRHAEPSPEPAPPAGPTDDGYDTTRRNGEWDR